MNCMSSLNSLIKSVVTDMSKMLFYKLTFIFSEITMNFFQLKKNKYLCQVYVIPPQVYNLYHFLFGFQDITLASASASS